MHILVNKYIKYRENRLFTPSFDIRELGNIREVDEVSRSMSRVILVKLGLSIRFVEIITKYWGERVKVSVKMFISFYASFK